MAKRSNNNFTGRRPPGDKPYDLNDSFVKKMASKMSDIMPQKSWLSKWFNSPGSNGNNFINREDDNNDIEEESLLQPPTKRPRIRMDVTHPPGTFSIQQINRKQTQDQDTGEFHDTLTSIAGPSSSHSFVASTPAIRNTNNILSSSSSSSKPILLSQNKNNNGLIGINGGNNDNNSESGDSTSGCSSLIPQINHKDSSEHQNYLNSLFSTRKNIIDNNKLNSYTNNLQSPRSLLIDSITRDSMSTRRPSFSVSMMNNSNSNNIDDNCNDNDSTLSIIDVDKNKLLSSPFYTGNTTFGGSNAIERSRKNLASVPGVSQFQLKVPRRSSVQVKPSNISTINNTSGISQTAKRIFEALENFSSPISDAKKIPINTTINSKKRTRDESFDTTTTTTTTIGSTTRVGLRHLTRELTVPTIPDMLRLKRRQKLQDTTLAARKIITANSNPLPTKKNNHNNNNNDNNNKEYHIRTDDDSSKFLGKLKSKINTQKRTTINLEEQVEQVNLPNITLPITNLPTFDISLPKPNNSHNTIINKNTVINTDDKESPTKIRKIESFKFSSTPSLSTTTLSSTVTTTTTATTTTTPTTSTSSSPNNTSNNFEFSSPIRLNNNNDVRKSLQPINDFTFSMPINAEPINNELETTTTSTTNNDTPSMNFIWSGTSTAPKPKLIKNDNLDKNNESFNNKIGELKSGSCMDILMNKKQQKNDGNNLWECSECFIKNNNNVDNCIACKVSKHKSSSINKKSSLENLLQSSINDNFKFNNTTNNDNSSCNKINLKSNDDNNDNLNNKNTSSPSLTTQENTIFCKGKIDDSIMDKLKPAKDSWECPGCMLRNPGNIITCPCCNASKPGLLKTTIDKPQIDTTKTQQNIFSFGIPTTTTTSSTAVAATTTTTTITTTTEQPSSSFSGFGDKFKKPTDVWSCDSCMVQNKNDINECVACGGLKPGTTSKEQQKPQQSSTLSLTSSTSSFSGFGDKFKKPAGAWTCDGCMIQNKSDVNECVACGGLKPGATPVVKTTLTETKPMFTFGIPAKIETTEKSTNKNETNGLFTFGNPSSTNQTTSFSFGIPTTTSNTETSGFTFAAPKKIDELKNNDKTSFTFNTPTDVKKIQDDNNDKEKSQINIVKQIESNISTTSNNQLSITNSSVISTPNTTILNSSNDKKTNQVILFEQTPIVSTVIKQQNLTDDKNLSKIETIEKPQNSLFTFGASSNQKLSTPPMFGEKTSEPSKTPLMPFGSTSSTASPLTNTFGTIPKMNNLPTFGAISANNDDNNKNSLFKSSKTVSFASPITTTTTTTTTIPTVSSATTTTEIVGFGGNTATTASSSSSSSSIWPSNTQLFGATPSATDNQSVATKNIFGSLSSVESTTKTPASNPSLFTFGSSSNTQTNKPTQSTSVFQFNSKPATASPIAAAATPTAATATPTAPASNSFGAFGTPVQAQNSNNFTFGSNSTPSATPAISNPSSFQFNSGTSNITNTSTSNEQKPSGFNSFSTFGTPTQINSATPAAQPFTFNSPKPTNATSFFGNSQSPTVSSFSSLTPANNNNFNFNTPTSATNTPAQPSSIGGFNFSSSSTPSTGGFNFNQPSTPQPVAFNPTSKPSFNFTQGSAPTTFMAPPQAASVSAPLGQRKIKKAVRRMPPR